MAEKNAKAPTGGQIIVSRRSEAPRINRCQFDLCAFRSQVLKVGTSSLVNPEKHRLNISNLARIIETVKALRSMGTINMHARILFSLSMHACMRYPYLGYTCMGVTN